MSRAYRYTPANQSLRMLAEDEDDTKLQDSEEEIDLETGAGDGSRRGSQEANAQRAAPALGKLSASKRVSWDAYGTGIGASSSNVPSNNEAQDDSDDGEVPQSFMIEDSRKATPKKSKGKAKESRSSGSGRTRPLHSVGGGKKLSSILPTHHTHSGSSQAHRSTVSTPPRPSEIDVDEDMEDGQHTPRAGAGPYDDRNEQERWEGWWPKQNRALGLDPHERALWNWINVYNLDAFLQEVYYYYQGKGIYSIALARGLNLLTVGFVIGFSTFLLGCIDYSKINPEKQMRLGDAIVDQCVSKFSGFTLLFFILFTAFYIWEIVNFIVGVRRLVDMYNFYTHLLKIPDADIQTISWPEVVRRIGAIREENPLTAISSKASGHNNTSTAKLDAHDVANRIMRQENYLIALFNKDVLDLRVPLPPILKRFVPEESGKGKMLTRALEWNLRFCLMQYLFDEHGKVRKVFLKSKNRRFLIEGLKRRFIFMGILNAIFAPFIVLYVLMYSFFRYFEQYHKDPSTVSGRRYTSYAQWKFREFNELPHLFIRRLDESYPLANTYIGQFPNEKVTLIMRFVAFVSGAFAAVLFLATIWDPDIFVHLEITPHRTVLFYLGLFGSVLAMARGMIPEENRVFDPEMLMTGVITYTHYMPDLWKGQLHSKRVHQEFGQLFAMKVLIFVEELASVVLTPFVLWFSLPPCAPVIIDFFREFTVHVDGRGYVCSFAEFNFERHGNIKFGAPIQVQDKKMMSNEGKMEKSFLNFKAANPDWMPTDPSGSLYLSRLQGFTAAHPGSFTFSPARQHSATSASPTGEYHESTLAERAQEYDRALKQSQYAARRRGFGAGSTFLGMSALGPPVASGAGPSASSIFGAMAGAQTVVLGDSQGSVMPATVTAGKVPTTVIPDEEVGPDGVMEGDRSYVDGAAGKRPKPIEEEEEDEGMEDGGVLGLLAQIYARRDAPSRPV
ncbi:autophagy protein atg9 [Paramarasmius palmivorus]|uniref:Autophagy-related protein 9 n=1 Tax=Paramarasmius palmivorus TaxID=297713 RepID=A0AAW0DQC1_9AGAR